MILEGAAAERASMEKYITKQDECMNSSLETKPYSGSSGQKHRSRMVRNWIEILLTNGPDEPIAEAFYVLYLSDGRKIEGKLDDRNIGCPPVPVQTKGCRI